MTSGWGHIPVIGEGMKFRGKAVTGTSLLMMLGVVCFATIIVSAVLISSNSLTFTNTTVTDPGQISLTPTVTPGNINLGNNAVYEFNANVPIALTDVVVTIDIAEAGIIAGDVTSATISYDGGAATSPVSYTHLTLPTNREV